MPVRMEQVSHTYMQGGPFESTAIFNVNLEIRDGEFVGLIGHTGSGKSTLVQHMNGLLKPTEVTVIVNDPDCWDSKNLKKVRQQVGLVFQYPEHQLFEETVEKDVAFGPKNLGLSQEEINERVREALQLVGLPYEEIKDRSPFELSGGQRRRVAIAGVLAMKPDILIWTSHRRAGSQRPEEIFRKFRFIRKRALPLCWFPSMEGHCKAGGQDHCNEPGAGSNDGHAQEVFARRKLKIGWMCPDYQFDAGVGGERF